MPLPLIPTDASEELCEHTDLPKYACSHCLHPAPAPRRFEITKGDSLWRPTRAEFGPAYMWSPSEAIPPAITGFVHIAGMWTDADMWRLIEQLPQLYMVETAVSRRNQLATWQLQLELRGIGAQVFNRYKNGLARP